MRLIGQEVDALAEHQLNEFAGERLLAGLSLKCRSRPEAVIPSLVFGLLAIIWKILGLPKNFDCDCSPSKIQIDSFL